LNEKVFSSFFHGKTQKHWRISVSVSRSAWSLNFFSRKKNGKRSLRRITLCRKPLSWSKIWPSITPLKVSIKVITLSKVKFNHFVESLTSTSAIGSFWLSIMFSTKWSSMKWSSFDKVVDFRRRDQIWLSTNCHSTFRPPLKKRTN
jgi:hypothetical protein